MATSISNKTPLPQSILFVCLGNICRSTMAEGVFKSVISKHPYQDLIGHVDSCGTSGFHIGTSPDRRTMATLKRHGIYDYSHSARQIQFSDFSIFDYIFVMDHSNLQAVEEIKDRTRGKAKIMMFGTFSGDESTEEIKDPYYGRDDGFEIVYEQCCRFSENFMKKISDQYGS